MIMHIASFLCLIITFRRRGIFPEMKFFFLYPLFGLIQAFSGYLMFFEELGGKYSKTATLVLKAFLFVEFGCFFWFYSKTITHGRLKNAVKIIALSYLLYTLLFWKNSFDLAMLQRGYTIQAIYILALAILFVINLFKSEARLNILNEPGLWVMSGSFVYFFGTIPLFISNNFIFGKYGEALELPIYSINYIFYTILYFLITRAILCRQTEKQSFT